MRLRISPDTHLLLRWTSRSVSGVRSFTRSNSLLPGVSWVNPRAADIQAKNKPAQLIIARELGLTLPTSLISNVPSEVEEFTLPAATDIYTSHSPGILILQIDRLHFSSDS